MQTMSGEAAHQVLEAVNAGQVTPEQAAGQLETIASDAPTTQALAEVTDVARVVARLVDATTGGGHG